MLPADKDQALTYWHSGGSVIDRYARQDGKPDEIARIVADDRIGRFSRIALEAVERGDFGTASHFATLAIQLIRACRAQDEWTRVGGCAALSPNKKEAA